MERSGFAAGAAPCYHTSCARLCIYTTGLSSSLEIYGSGSAIAADFFRLPFPRRHIEVGLTGRVLATQVFEKASECVNDFLKFVSLEVGPFVEVDRRVYRPLFHVSFGDEVLGRGPHLGDGGFLLLKLPFRGGLLAVFQQCAPPLQDVRHEVGKVITAVAPEFDARAEIVGKDDGRVFKVAPQQPGCLCYLVLGEFVLNFGPDVVIVPDARTGIDGPAAERLTAGNQVLGLHVLEPHAVVGGENELRVGEFLFEKSANFAPVTGIDRHEHVVEDGEGEFMTERVLHERQIKAQPHGVLMAFAVVGAGRKEPAAVEIHVSRFFGVGPSYVFDILR
jgi:hypothetical protein